MSRLLVGSMPRNCTAVSAHTGVNFKLDTNGLHIFHPKRGTWQLVRKSGEFRAGKSPCTGNLLACGSVGAKCTKRMTPKFARAPRSAALIPSQYSSLLQRMATRDFGKYETKGSLRASDVSVCASASPRTHFPSTCTRVKVGGDIT